MIGLAHDAYGPRVRESPTSCAAESAMLADAERNSPPNTQPSPFRVRKYTFV
jgi:hypothetical protein